GFWADRTALHEAASHGRALQLKQLIESGTSVNMVDVRTIHGSTPLCNACASGSLECAKLLLDYGAKVNPSLTALTASPLHEACIQGNIEVVKLMICSGAQLEAFDVHFGPPLHIACAKGHVNCVKEMLKAGNPLSLQQLCRITVRKMLGSRASEVIGCWSERTEVHKAASLGQASELQHLIQSGASVNMVAVDSITPLHEACLRGQAQCVRLLLDAGAQVDARNVDGSTPLCDACSSGSLECVSLLLEHGAKANPALTSRTASPLHEACMGGNADCVKLLIAMDACLEAYDLYYGTPLHVACANEHTSCVKVLLNAGAKVNAARLHETPLHHAAKNMQVEMIEILVEFGANIYARDQHNRKPVDYTTPGSPSAVCLQFYETTPMSLQQLSRLAVRKKLGTRALKVMDQLHIPKLLISYLCYHEPHLQFTVFSRELLVLQASEDLKELISLPRLCLQEGHLNSRGFKKLHGCCVGGFTFDCIVYVAVSSP
ncbi:Ankyrin repeat and SOCS box protein 13, partial [Nibea albiflora]